MPTVTPSPVSLSAARFRAKVLELEPKVAVFDCDGTLWSGDAGSAFMRWTMDTGLLGREKARWLNDRYEEYREGFVSELAICGEMVQVYAGLEEKRLRKAAKAFFSEAIERNIFPEMLDLVGELQAQDVDIWAVSSTCDWVIEEGLKRFGIPSNRVLAACVECDAGVATDRLRDVPTDEGKVQSLKRVGVTAPDVVFGNSIHDAAMLTIARGAFAVNPSPALLEYSAEHEWPVFFPAAVTRR